MRIDELDGYFLVALIASQAALFVLSGCSECSDRNEEEAEDHAVARPARVGLDKAGVMHIGPDDRCPVCAMPVSQHQRFASAIELRDGRTYYFCGTGCMIRTWLHPEVFLGETKEALSRAVVREYFNGEHVDAEKAIFVAGSDVVGPMGKALVPLKTEADVDVFIKRHKGKVTFRLSEMDDERWQAITGKRAVGGTQR